MKTAEEFFWENIPKYNLSRHHPANNVLDRERFNFDDVYILMEEYAKKREQRWCSECMHMFHNKKSKGYHDIEEYYKE